MIAEMKEDLCSRELSGRKLEVKKCRRGGLKSRGRGWSRRVYTKNVDFSKSREKFWRRCLEKITREIFKKEKKEKLRWKGKPFRDEKQNFKDEKDLQAFSWKIEEKSSGQRGGEKQWNCQGWDSRKKKKEKKKILERISAISVQKLKERKENRDLDDRIAGGESVKKVCRVVSISSESHSWKAGIRPVITRFPGAWQS